MTNEQTFNKTSEERAQEILNEAKTWSVSISRPMNYTDYEKFKQKLHAEGLFGYEGELARILHV